MHPIRFHTGNYERVLLSDGFIIITQGVETGKASSINGQNVVKMAEKEPINVFSNVETVFSGFRRGIVELGLDVDPDIEVIFYPEDVNLPHKTIKINRFGRLESWPHDMLNQTVDDSRSIIMKSMNLRKKGPKRSDG